MRRLLLILGMLLVAGRAEAQDSEADHLRDALRHVTVDLRASQDQNATLQAQLDDATRQKTILQQQVDALNAKLAATQAPAARPAGPSPDQLRAAASQSAAQAASLRSALAKWQSAYQQAAEIARAKDAESRTLAGTSKATASQLASCKDANTRLIGVANDILHLYRTQDFHQILVWSYEPLIGFDQVKLQNIVQDYEDKIRGAAYTPPGAGAN